MLTSQQFCVRWNSYSSNLQSVFPRLLNSEHFVDITLACEGQMIKCHKVVLSACSTYFEKLLVQNPCQHPIIFMKDMKHWEVQALVDFMYKGEVNVSQEELNSLLVAAEALQIRGLCGSDNANRQQEGNKQISPLSKVPAVSLPNDIVLSGGTSMGRDSPPQKKRKVPNDDKEQPQSVMPRITGVSSASGIKTGSDLNAILASQSSSEQFRADGATEEFEEEIKEKRIKQEVDMDENFLEGEGEAEAQEEEVATEPQEDSDSNNREEVHSTPVLDQPGPSGINTAGTAEKAATVEFSWLPKVRPYRQYSNDNLWAALMDVKQGGSVYRASKEHGIPRKTLRNWMKRWNIKSVYSPPVRRSIPPILEAPVGGEISKGSGVTLTPVIPKLMAQKRSALESRANLGTLTVSSGVTIAPSVPSLLAASSGRARQNSRWMPGCELETNSGVVISPAVPSVLVKSDPDIQLTKSIRK